MDNSFYPNTKQSFVLIIFFFASYLIYFTLIGFLFIKFDLLPQKMVKTVLFAGSSISLLPLIILFSKKSNVPLKWHVKLPGINIILLMLFLSIALGIVSSPLAYTGEYFDNMSNGKLKLFVFCVPDFDLNMVIHAISSVVIAPIVEEYFFRKQILGQLLKKYSPFVAIIASSVFFAIGHLRLHELGSLLISGIFYGIVYYTTKSVVTSILLHSYHNLSNFFYKYEYQTINETKLLIYITMMAMSIVVTYLVISYLWRHSSIKKDYGVDDPVAL